jgi:hypothetical protein
MKMDAKTLASPDAQTFDTLSIAHPAILFLALVPVVSAAIYYGVRPSKADIQAQAWEQYMEASK